jgi:hypothetical protein
VLVEVVEQPVIKTAARTTPRKHLSHDTMVN